MQRFRSWSCINNGQECTNCLKKYKGEEYIKYILKLNNINYIPQYMFSDCRGRKKPLQFDFAIFDNLENILFMCEYDGKHHFQPINFGGISDKKALDNFKETQINDQIKNQYCKNNNIKLLRIPYWEFNNIEEILIRELNLNDIKLAI